MTSKTVLRKTARPKLTREPTLRTPLMDEGPTPLREPRLVQQPKDVSAGWRAVQ